MRRFLPLVLVLGCTESDLAMRSVVAAENPLQEVAERTEIRWIGEARLAPFGEPIGAPTEATRSWRRPQVAVVEVGERIRVVHEGRDAHLLLWLDRQDLGTWVIAGSRGGAVPGAVHGETGVWFDGGVEVELAGQDGDWLAVDAQSREFSVSAWVPAFDVGPYWVEEARPVAASVSDVWVRSGAELLDAPGGDRLGEVEPWIDGEGEEQSVAHLGARLLDLEADHGLVELVSDGITVRAWLPTDDFADRVEGGHGSSCCGGCGGATGGWGVYPNHFLPAGTPLYAGPDAELVGETVADRGWGIAERDVDGWTAVRVPTPWGSAVVWAW